MEVLNSWLADAGIHSHDLEQDFASGYLFAQLLQAHSLQPDLHAFTNKSKPDAYLNNYKRLQPTLVKLGVQFDTRTAQALINKEPGLAAKVLLSIKQQLDTLGTNLQASTHPASRTLQQCTVATSPTRGLLEAQKLKSQHATLDASNTRYFEDVMRKNSSSPNKLMEALHLKQFADEGSRQAQAAAAATAAAAASQAAGRSAFRASLKGKMAATRTDKATKLQRDEAVHAAILRHQDDVERQELRVEKALAELGAHKQQDQRRAAAADAAAGIDAFEMTLKRLGATGAGSLADASLPPAGESPMATLGRIRSFAPTAAKLADSKDEYLAAIKARQQEEAAARKEREGRRHRMLVEQQAARAAAEGRVEANCLLEVLVRRSAEEQKLAQHLWQLQQEKAAMEAGRKLREEQYAALKDKEWEDTLRREAELHRTLHAQHAATVQQELASWRQQQEAAAAAADAEKAGLARDTAWQLVQLAERVVEYREATGGQAVPLADWRAWLSLFLAGDPALGTPIIQSDPAALQEPPSAQHTINTAELRDYLTGQGVWALDAAPAPAAAPASSSPSRPTTPAVQAPIPQPNKALGEVVADLAMLSQKLKARPAFSAQPQAQQAQLQLEWESPAVHSDATAAEEPAPAPEAAVVTAAEAAAGSTAAPGADVIHNIPLKLAVAGSPYSGKSTVAHALAQAFGLKLLCPQQLVTEAVSAAAGWTQQQQQQQVQPTSDSGAAAPAEPAVSSTAQTDASPSQLVALGLQAHSQLQAGQPVSDEVLVQLLLLGMQQAATHMHVPPELPQPEAPVKGGKATSPAKSAPGAKSEAGGAGASAAGGRHSSTSGTTAQGPASTANALTGVAAAMAAGLGSTGPGPALPAALAAGAVGRGFVLDGFPASAAQAVLLEKALTGLDLSAEQQLVQGASVVVPPPAAKLPQLQRPLLSGLDAVIMLECTDEAQALQRVLGRRLDPVTGQLYHLDFDPPPANNPGLCERLVQPPGQEEEQGQLPERLCSWARCSFSLSSWLARFSSLRRPLDGCMPLAEVLLAAGDVVSGILTAKGAAQAAQAAAKAARQAHVSAEKAQELSAASQLHAEAAARDLLAAKKAEMQVLPLLTGGKTADPAAAELVKAQAAAKCAEQLKACHAATSEATAQAQHARSAAEAAAAAVLSAKKAVGDAVVSAEAQAQANKAAASAQAAAAAAAEAANKAEAAKQLADGYAQDAEKWAAAAEIPADAAIAPAARVAAPVTATVAPATHAPAAAGSAAPSRPLSGRVSSTAVGTSTKGVGLLAPVPGASSASINSSTDGSVDLSLGSAGALPAPLVQSLHEEWSVLKRVYVEGMGRGFAGLREAHRLALSQVAANRSWFSSLLQQPDQGQALLQDFVSRFNAVELDMRKSDETKGELLLRCEELRDSLWAICDAKHEAAEAARLKLAADGSAAEHVALLGTQLTSLVQAELDRFMATAQFLWSYCHGSHGVYNPPAADKALGYVTVLQPGQEMGATSKAEQGKAGSAGAVAAAYLAPLQQRLPQLAAALKSALAAAAAAEASALSMVSDAQQKSAAAAAHAAVTANAAAAAAAAAAGQPTTTAPGHRSAGAPKSGAGATASSAGGSAASASGAGAASSKAAVAAAAANSKLAATSEEAAATAAAAAAAAAAMPGQAVLAAVHAELQAALGWELALLQHRLSLLGRRAAALVEEVVALHGATNSQMAELSHARYVAECGAVAALERVIKAAAAAGKPLAHDLRLEGEFLVVDSTQQLVPPPPEPVPPRPAPPSLPQGVLSEEQLCATAAAMQSAQHPAGCLTVQAAVDLLLGLASQGVLPAAWRDIDAIHMASALAAFDPTYSGYLDWRELLLALSASALPAIHTASAAQVAAQAARLAAADGDQDGCLTKQEFEGVAWWFAPRQELVEEAQADPAQHRDVLHELARCRAFAALLWDVFKQPAAPAAAPAAPAVCVPDSPAPAAPPASSTPPTPTTAKGGSRRGTAAGSRPGTAAAAAATAAAAAADAPASPKAPPAASATAATAPSGGAAPVAPAAAAAAAPADPVSHVVPWQALLLYLCPDRDLYAGISKAMSVVTQRADAGVRVDAQGVLRMCYPLLQPQELAAVCRAPLTAQQVSAAVAAAAATAAPAAATATATTAAGGNKGTSSAGNAGSRKPSSPGFAVAVTTDAHAAAASEACDAGCIKPSQLMYGAACERVVTLLLHRYQLKDVYVSALL